MLNRRRLGLVAILGVVVVAAATLLARSLGGGGSGVPSGPALRWVDADPAWSPDGRLLAFVRGAHEGPGTEALFVLDSRTGVVRQLTRASAQVSDSFPSWSPDGRSIVFRRELQRPSTADCCAVDTHTEVYRVDADGQRLTQLTRNGFDVDKDDFSPKWSPNGREIGYLQFRGPHPGDPIDPWVMNPDGTAKHRLAIVSGGFSWSPDGSQLLYETTEGIWRADANGQHRREIIPYSTTGTRWSPDDSRLVFTQGDGTLSTARADGSHLHQLTKPPDEYESDGAIGWSPNGRLIAFVRHCQSCTSNPGDLFVIHADGTGEKQLPIKCDGACVWSPNGTLVVGGNMGIGNYPLVELNADGSGAKRLTQTR